MCNVIEWKLIKIVLSPDAVSGAKANMPCAVLLFVFHARSDLMNDLRKLACVD